MIAREIDWSKDDAMTVSIKAQMALVALNRFGLGARGGNSGDLANAAADPKGFVKAELASPRVAMLGGPNLRPSEDLLAEMYGVLRQRREALAQANQTAPSTPAASDAPAATAPTSPAPASPAPASPAPPRPQPNFNIVQDRFRSDALARIQRAHAPACGFVERLVGFWSNHFCISAVKGPGV
ncbi:MAG: uncharacterized protein JWO28_189, partial [Hyphomicrobiales bacterium]|nr:uncharacterized protein [Hyphomicrobiales bacterium]